MRQRVEGRNVGCLYVEGVITDINQGTKQYTVQLASDEIVSKISQLNSQVKDIVCVHSKGLILMRIVS